MQTVLTADNLGLVTRIWPAEARAPGAARGVVVVVHGLGEHADRQEPVALRLSGQGFDVVGYDQRGHGFSPGPRGGIPQDDSLLDDLARVIDATRQAFAGPLVLLGHSLGGLIAARFVVEAKAEQPAAWSRPVDALVMSSPALDPGASALQRLLLATVARLLPDLAVGNGLNPNWISRDPRVVDAYRADALVHDRITGRLGRFVASQGPAVIAAAADWQLPTLLMWACADRCVAPRGAQAFAAVAPKAVVTSRPWGGLYHEIFNEPERELVFETLTRWLDGWLPERPLQ